MNLTQETLKQLLDYNPETGVFTWKVRRGGKANAGTVAGSPNKDGYINISIFKVLHPAHRLAWLYVHGRWPDDEIDHEDKDKTNNRISNLRECTRQQNCINKNRQSSNTTGFKGVHFCKRMGKFASAITYKVGSRKFLGYFETPEAAHEAYCIAGRELFGPFFNAG